MTIQHSYYETAVEAMNGLLQRGYSVDLNLVIRDPEKRKDFNPDDFEVTEFHRFEGATNPSDEEVVYAIESKDGKIKGVLYAAFGTYAETFPENWLKKLSMNVPTP